MEGTTQVFKFNCPYCRQPIEAEDAWIDQVAECPNCGKSVTIQKSLQPVSKQSSFQNEPSKEMTAKWKAYDARIKAEETQDEGRTMDFLMGMALPGLGLILAAIVGGRKGLKRAFLGLWLLFAILLLINLLINVLGR